ncbi:MAG: glycoside hydrolase family 65 protein [Armatimonadetes bacterium]|nr:glycoside hydrolase family 65 protein [Armatimonadota bacterium]
MRKGHLLGIVPLIVIGCAPKEPVPVEVAKTLYPPKASPSHTKVDPFVLASGETLRRAPALLTNGLIGIRVEPNGTGGSPPTLLVSKMMVGKDTRYNVADNGFPKTRGDSFYSAQVWDAKTQNLKALPNPLEGSVFYNGFNVSRLGSSVSNYRQSLDLHTGILTTAYSNAYADVVVETVIDPESACGADRWTLTPNHVPEDAGDADNPHFKGSHEGNVVSKGHVHPRAQTVAITFLDVVDATANGAPIPRPVGTPVPPARPVKVDLSFSAAIDSGSIADLTTVVGEAPEGKCAFTRRFAVNLPGKPPESLRSFEEIVKRSKAHLDQFWKTNIEIEGSDQDAQAINAALFYVRQSIAKSNAFPGGPFGVTSTTYGGHMFWDADIFLFPALALLDPEKAATIPSFRLQTAKASNGAIRFPWESGPQGQELAPSRFQNEIHGSGSVLWGLNLAAQLGLADPQKVSSVASGVAAYYQKLAVKRSDGKLELQNVRSPDENWVGNNDLYTNLLADWATGGRKWAGRFFLPRDDKSLLNYEQDPVMGYKQAAAFLAVYPLQYPEAEKQALTMLNRFGPKLSAYGPAMSNCLMSIAFARADERGAAYEQWKQAVYPYLRPLGLFSERRHAFGDTYFTTGAAGSIQAILFGLCGIRIDTVAQPGALWQTPLKEGAILSIKPHIPDAWKRVKLNGITILGRKLSLDITNQAVTATVGA